MNALSEWVVALFSRIELDHVVALGTKVFQALLVLLAAVWISRLLQRMVERRLRHENQKDDGVIRTYKNIVRLGVMIPGTLLAIHLTGINLSSVFTTSGLFAVAIAFAMKNVAENFISGTMLRFERAIKPGDVLETDGAMVRVKNIGMRATIVRTKDEKDLLIPNSQLVQTRVANYTYRDAVCRVWTTLGVHYSSDLKRVRQVLEDVCGQMKSLSNQHAPEVLLTHFGSSSVNYKVSVWIENPWASGLVKSDLNEAIWWALKDAGIVIALPQLDVHFGRDFGSYDTNRKIQQG